MRTHGKSAAPNGFNTSSKLSNEQWDAVLAELKNGMSVRNVGKWIEATWGITLATSAIAGNRRVQEWRSQEKVAVAEQAAATLQAHVGEVADVVVEQIEVLRKEATRIRREIKEGPSEDGMPLDKLWARLKSVDDEIRKTVETFSKLLANSKDTAALDKALKEQDQKEAEDAIDLLLETLKVEVVPLTEADRILNDRYSKPSGTDSGSQPGEAS